MFSFSPVEIIGIIGGSLILVSFVEVSLGKWRGTSYRYEICNLFGGTMIGVYGFSKQAYVNVLLNITFASFAVFALFHTYRRHQQRRGNRASTKPSIRGS